jgi:hypothetical protein
MLIYIYLVIIFMLSRSVLKVRLASSALFRNSCISVSTIFESRDFSWWLTFNPQTYQHDKQMKTYIFVHRWILIVLWILTLVFWR